MDKKPNSRSRSGGVLGGILLIAVLVVLALGVYGAVYLDEFRPTRTTVTAQLPPADNFTASRAAMPAPASTPLVSAIPVPPSVAPPPPPPLASAAPSAPAPAAAPSTATPVPLTLSAVNPAAGRQTAGPGIMLKPGYWVEYGAYDGPRYADLLVKKLEDLNIRSEITYATGAKGQRFYRVRSVHNSDRQSAETALRKVSQSLGIKPLLHHSAVHTEAVAFTPKPMAPSSAKADIRYWVQFASYSYEGYAKSLVKRLQTAGVSADVVELKQGDGKQLYLVRSLPLRSQAEAKTAAAAGKKLTGAQVIIGHTAYQKSL